MNYSLKWRYCVSLGTRTNTTNVIYITFMPFILPYIFFNLCIYILYAALLCDIEEHRQNRSAIVTFPKIIYFFLHQTSIVKNI